MRHPHPDTPRTRQRFKSPPDHTTSPKANPRGHHAKRGKNSNSLGFINAPSITEQKQGQQRCPPRPMTAKNQSSGQRAFPKIIAPAAKPSGALREEVCDNGIRRVQAPATAPSTKAPRHSIPMLSIDSSSPSLPTTGHPSCS